MGINSSKLNSLQLIRAFAMILVLFIHLDYFFTKIFDTKLFFGFFFPGGDGGVDLFFVLSGFIIYHIHSSDFGKRDRLKSYLIKRFIRIYPVYWIVTILLIVLHFFLPQFGLGNETQPLTILRSFLLIPSTHAPILHAAWTLIYEVLFYISFGFLIYFGLKKMRLFVIAIIVGTVVSWFYSINYNSQLQSSIFYSFFSYHNFEFLLGCLGAYLVKRREIKIAKQMLLMGILAFFSMLLLEYDNGYPIYPLRLFGYGVSSFLIITAVSSMEISGRHKISNSWIYNFLILLGNASFSIYLTHQVLISGIGRVMISLELGNLINVQGVMLLTLVSTTVLGIGFYMVAEKPILLILRKKLLPTKPSI